MKNLKIRSFKKLAFWHGISIISQKQGIYLSKLIQATNPKKVLEIGTGIGYSLGFINISAPKNSRIVSLEYAYQLNTFVRRLFPNWIKNGRISLVRADAFEYLIKTPEKFDFVFFDSAPSDFAKFLVLLENDHLTKDAVLVARLKKGTGYLMSNYLQIVQDSKKYQTEYKDFGKEIFIVSKIK